MTVARVTLFALLAACSGTTEPAAPPPEPTTAPAPEPKATQDTGDAAPKPAPVDPEAERRKEFFETVSKDPTKVPAPAPTAEPQVAAAPAPAPVPAPAVAAAATPKPAAPRPAPRPEPLPKPTTDPNAPVVVGVAPAAGGATASSATTTSTRPAPTSTSNGDAVADAAPLVKTEFGPEALAGDPLAACGDAAELDRAATKGALTDSDLACLEGAFQASTSVTQRERLSTVTIRNAYAANDPLAQEELLYRHLSQVDGANAEIAYRYALTLYRKGPSEGAEVVKWSNVALTNRALWTGETYAQRVYAIYKLRAAASQQVLTNAQAERDKARALEDTKRYAREWLAYARESGQDAAPARELCLVTSQSPEWCDAP